MKSDILIIKIMWKNRRIYGLEKDDLLKLHPGGTFIDFAGSIRQM